MTTLIGLVLCMELVCVPGDIIQMHIINKHSLDPLFYTWLVYTFHAISAHCVSHGAQSDTYQRKSRL